MRKISRFIYLPVMAVCLLGSFIAHCEAAVQIKGKALSQIGDIVAEVTGSEFSEVQKHSLLLFERYGGKQSNVDVLYYQPHIFTINSDGSKNGQYDLATSSSYVSFLSPRSDVVQKMDLSVSNGNTFFYTDAAYNPYAPSSRFGYWNWANQDYNVYASFRANFATYSNRSTWGNCYLTVKGMEGKNIFAYIHSSVNTPLRNLYLDVNLEGSVLRIQNGESLGYKITT